MARRNRVGFEAGHGKQDMLHVVVSAQTGEFIEDLKPKVGPPTMVEVMRRSILAFANLIRTNPAYRDLLEHPIPEHADLTGDVWLHFNVSPDYRRAVETIIGGEHLEERQVVEYSVRWMWLTNRFMTLQDT